MPLYSGYSGGRVALLTQHGKERVIAPVLERGLECIVEHVTGFDTDQLGTFARETARPGTPLDAARRKARKGMELSSLPLGIASEGSFGPDPFAGLFPWNMEILIWIDDNLGLEIIGVAEGAASGGHIQSGDWEQIEAYAKREDFPRQRLVLRPDGQDDPRIEKGIGNWGQLKSSFDDALAQSGNGQVFVEPDLRAFASPRRMQRIEQAACDLLRRIESTCPECGVPGFWITERSPGLPCAACGFPTSSYRSEVWTCLHCAFQRVEKRRDRVEADPTYCAYCNP